MTPQEKKIVSLRAELRRAKARLAKFIPLVTELQALQKKRTAQYKTLKDQYNKLILAHPVVQEDKKYKYLAAYGEELLHGDPIRQRPAVQFNHENNRRQRERQLQHIRQNLPVQVPGRPPRARANNAARLGERFNLDAFRMPRRIILDRDPEPPEVAVEPELDIPGVDE